MSGDKSQGDERASDRWRIAFCVLVGLLVVGALGWLFRPPHRLGTTSESFWNVVVGNRWFLDSIRVVAAVGGIYIIVSIVARISEGTWLDGFGPFTAKKTEAKSASAEMELQKLRTDYVELKNRFDQSQQRVGELISSLSTAAGRIRFLQNRLRGRNG
jgi:hypothetical protein